MSPASWRLWEWAPRNRYRLKKSNVCDFVQVPRISNEQSPIANLDYPFAFSNIASAKGCYRFAIGDCCTLIVAAGGLTAMKIDTQAPSSEPPRHQPFVPQSVSMSEVTWWAVFTGLPLTLILGAPNASLGLRSGALTAMKIDTQAPSSEPPRHQ